MKRKMCTAISGILLLTGLSNAGSLAGESPETDKSPAQSTSIYDITVTDIDGHDVQMSKYKGKVLLIVNVASKCGFTRQYTGLENIYTEYKDKGFEVLGFPANDFGKQEPGSNEQIKKFCTSQFKVDFPMFSKISVKGADKHDLYKFLTEKSTNPKFAGELSWNFNKFLIDRSGTTVARFVSRDKPESPKVTQAIRKALAAVESAE